MTRRDFLWQTGGLGGIALAHLLGAHELLAGPTKPRPEFNGGLHHPARVKRVIQLFMNGGVSQMDTFDYKPELEQAARPEGRLRHQSGRHQHAGRRHEVALPVEAARPVRPLGQQRLSARGPLRG